MDEGDISMMSEQDDEVVSQVENPPKGTVQQVKEEKHEDETVVAAEAEEEVVEEEEEEYQRECLISLQQSLQGINVQINQVKSDCDKRRAENDMLQTYVNNLTRQNMLITSSK
ncbi:hypothetical protein PPACK8108_LOCUS19145 [Phakopsora pachyrhizi]|uniref:Uncharacterized protein n=1 Tax=Phakopsora pachyrhizi TaxID=170000 RepID=A0AAV0BBQ3_PHAPC|nr:hypothetical protein PPACK8108_LOCUS19145 [Phakopsora pachyrhizi]